MSSPNENPETQDVGRAEGAGRAVGCDRGLCVPGVVAICVGALGPEDDCAKIEEALAPSRVLWLQGMEGVGDVRRIILPIA